MGAAFEGAGEDGVNIGDVKIDGLADIFKRRVAHQSARQQACFAQNLKAITNAQHRHARFCGIDHSARYRRLSGHRATAQIVAIGKAARQYDQVKPIWQAGFLMPHHGDIGPNAAL
jgi:hypothetical protein